MSLKVRILKDHLGLFDKQVDVSEFQMLPLLILILLLLFKRFNCCELAIVGFTHKSVCKIVTLN